MSRAKRPTNMIYFSAPDAAAADKILAGCRKEQVVFNKTSGDTFRLVTHLDVSPAAARTAAEIIVKEFRR